MKRARPEQSKKGDSSSTKAETDKNKKKAFSDCKTSSAE
jgi:hypothetical protein